MNSVNCNSVHSKTRCFLDNKVHLTTKCNFGQTFQHTSGSISETHLFLIKANSVPTFALNMRTKEHQKRTLFLQSFEAAACLLKGGQHHSQWIHGKISTWHKIAR